MVSKITFLWYDVRDETKRWWCGCSGRKSPLMVVVDIGAVVVAERWDNAVGIR